jgi:hypothetical protein
LIPGKQQVLDALIRAGWDRLCGEIRSAGERMIENPERAIRTLRFIADKLEENQRGKQEQAPAQPEPMERRESGEWP